MIDVLIGEAPRSARSLNLTSLFFFHGVMLKIKYTKQELFWPFIMPARFTGKYIRIFYNNLVYKYTYKYWKNADPEQIGLSEANWGPFNQKYLRQKCFLKKLLIPCLYSFEMLTRKKLNFGKNLFLRVLKTMNIQTVDHIIKGAVIGSFLSFFLQNFIIRTNFYFLKKEYLLHIDILHCFQEKHTLRLHNGSIRLLLNDQVMAAVYC